MRRIAFWSAAIGAIFVILGVSSCATPPEPAPVPPAPDPVEAPPVEEAAPEEDVYTSISLSISTGDPEAALATFLQAELDDPDSPDTTVLLANLYISAGDPTQAEELLRQVLAEHPEHEGALLTLALLAGARGDATEERELLQRLLAVNPTQSQANAALGELQLRERQFAAAEDAFRTALQEDPENLVALVGMGNVKLRTSQPEVAEEFLSLAIDAAPEYSFAWADRSRARALQQNFRQAESDLEQAIQLDPDYSWHFFDRGRVRLERNDPAGAREDFNEALTRDSRNFMGYVLRARAHDILEERDAAITDYRTALELRPDYLPARSPLAVLLFEAERFEEAATEFDRAFRNIHPNDPKEHGLILLSSLSRSFAGDPRGGRQYLERMAAELPQTGLVADMARYMTNPGSDQYIFRVVTQEQDRFLRTRMKFFLAAQYELLGRSGSARALYLEVQDENIRGFVETRLARVRHASLIGNL